MNVGVFEDPGFVELLPLTWMRAAFELRCGRDRLIDKLAQHFGPVNRVWCRPELATVVHDRQSLAAPDRNEEWLLINGRVLLNGEIKPPPPGVAWTSNGSVLAFRVQADAIERLTSDVFLGENLLPDWISSYSHEEAPDELQLVHYPWNLVHANARELRRQCRGAKHNGQIDPGVHMLEEGAIHVARGARVKPGSVLDAENGPILIDRDVMIQPNCVIEGPCYIGPKSIIRSGANLRAGTTIGPVCRVGGEIDATIFQGYSNKQHDGFLGHSFIGEWVNLGANTTTSDLKNTYGAIRVSLNGVGIETGEHFLGSIIGDHSKTGIGTILPTGCIVGVAASIFTQTAVPKFVPSYAWLTGGGMSRSQIDKTLHVARIVMARRDRHMTLDEEALLRRIFDQAAEVEKAGWGAVAPGGE